MKIEKMDGKVIYSDGREKVIPYGKTKIKAKEYSHNKEILEVVLPDSIIAIEDMAFFACVNMKTIVLPISLLTIGRWAFSGCRNLKNISIEADIKSDNIYFLACLLFFIPILLSE